MKFRYYFPLIILVFFASAINAQEKVNQVNAQGKKHGRWVKFWPETNSRAFEGNYENGIPVGEFVGWYETGEVHTIQKYFDKGKVKRAKMYHPNGYIMAKGKYINELRDSVWLFYDVRGRLQAMENYKDGVKDGTAETYFTNDVMISEYEVGHIPGRLSHQATYVKGVLHGPYKEFFPSGPKKLEGTYVDGNFDGRVTRYYLGGVKESEVFYKHAVLNGYSTFYNEDGTVKSKIFYLNGKILEGEKLEKHLEKIRQEKAQQQNKGK